MPKGFLANMFTDLAAEFRSLPPIPNDKGGCPAELALAVAAQERGGGLLIDVYKSGAFDMPNRFGELVRNHRNHWRRLWRAVVGPTWRPRSAEVVPLREDGAGILVNPDELAGGLLFDIDPAAFPPVPIVLAGSPNFKNRDARACAWFAARIEGEPIQTAAATHPPLSPSEAETLQLLEGLPPATGMRAAEIAHCLEVATSTVTGRIIPKLRQYYDIPTSSGGYYLARQEGSNNVADPERL